MNINTNISTLGWEEKKDTMALLEQITNFHSDFLANLEHDFLNDKRISALKKFENIGFPTKKDEEYKYTNLREIIKRAYNFAPTSEHTISKEIIDNLHLGEEDFDYVVFVNGVLHKELSKISVGEVEYYSLNEAFYKEEYKDKILQYFDTATSEKNVFADLNLAYFNTGFFMHVPKNTKIEKPIHVFYLSQNQSEDTFYNTRNLLVVETGAEVEIIESHHNFDSGFTFTNSVTEIFSFPNAKADWHKLQNDSENSYLVDNTYVKQEKDSLATVNTFSFGGKLVRNNLVFLHNGENINSFMNGITVISDKQLVDHHTEVHHNFPHCNSYQNYKGIFGGKSHGVFNGNVLVDKIAQKTDAYQQNNNILLSEGAKIDSKPQLLIFADDVKCSHGCTVGQLDEESLFYLRARGIGEKDARGLLLYAFAHDAMKNIDIPALHTKVSKLLAEKLEVEMTF